MRRKHVGAPHSAYVSILAMKTCNKSYARCSEYALSSWGSLCLQLREDVPFHRLKARLPCKLDAQTIRPRISGPNICDDTTILDFVDVS